MEKRYLIAVCDSLRKGFFMDYLIVNNPSNKYIGSFDSEHKYLLMHNSNTNLVKLYEGGLTSITFDVFEICSISLNNILYIYKANDTRPEQDRLYELKSIDTPYGEAKAFFSTCKINNLDTEVLSGDVKNIYNKNKKERWVNV